MKTKYAASFMLIGILLAGGAGAQISKQPINGQLIMAVTIMGLSAIALFGYGLKLRQLAKKGIETT